MASLTWAIGGGSNAGGQSDTISGKRSAGAQQAKKGTPKGSKVANDAPTNKWIDRGAVPDTRGPDGVYIAEIKENPLVCCATCISDCCVPTSMCCCCCLCIPHRVMEDKGCEFCIPHKFWAMNTCESWLLRHPITESTFFPCLRSCIVAHDAQATGSSLYRGMRKQFGDTFCDNLKVECGDHRTMAELLVHGQNRAPHLGQCPLNPHRLPHRAADGSNLFILTLDNMGGEGGGEVVTRVPLDLHAHMRKVLYDHLINDQAYERQKRDNPVTARLLADLKKGFDADPGKYGAWTKGALPTFIMRYMHWAMFGIDLSQEDYDLLYEYYYTPSPGLGTAAAPDGTTAIAATMSVIGDLTVPDDKYAALMVKRDKAPCAAAPLSAPAVPPHHQRGACQVVSYYLKCDALATFAETERATKAEFIDVLVTGMAMAGLQGPLSACTRVLQRKNVPTDFVVPTADERDKLRLFVLEILRLKPAVFGATCAAAKPLQVAIGGKETVFPPGTPVHCNFVVQGRSAVWDKPHEFRPYERADDLWGPNAKLMVFNSVGDKVHGDQPTPEEPHRSHHGRMCPGRGLALTMAMDVAAVCLGGKNGK